MKGIHKIFIAIVIVILLIASIFYVFLEDVDDTDDKPINGDDSGDENGNGNDGNESDGNDENGNGADDDRDITRHVFIEKATFETCEYCVPVGKILHDLYESADYPVYYVSMIRENDNAKDRLVDDYNIANYPAVFIDGGYRVVLGAKEKSVFQKRVNDALSRNRPSIYVNMSAEWDKNASKITVSGFVENLDDKSYSGFLKVYLTEKVTTRWQDNDGNAYHFAFLEFILEEDIELSVNEIANFTKSIDDNGLDPENLKIFTVVFNSESTKKYSDPSDDGGQGQNSFDAHYVDGVAAAEVVEGGNTPPAVGINIPKQGRFHLFGNPIINYKFKNTFIIGRFTLDATAEDDSKIEKIEFYIDNNLLTVDTSAPYELEIKKIGLFRNLIRKHTIKVKAYDDTGKTAEDSLDILAICL
jgi:hypothetical protein